MGEVEAWPARAYGRPRARERGRHRRRITAALRRYGIDDRLFLDAAQDADRWRDRLRRGWQPRCGAVDGSEASEAESADGGAAGGDPADAAGDLGWPSWTTVVKSSLRTGVDLACGHCGYRTGFAAWLDAHVRRMHPGETPALSPELRRQLLLRQQRLGSGARPAPAPLPATGCAATGAAAPSDTPRARRMRELRARPGLVTAADAVAAAP